MHRRHERCDDNIKVDLKEMEGQDTGSIWFRVMRSCDHCNRTSGSINGGILTEEMSNCQPFKHDSPPWKNSIFKSSSVQGDTPLGYVADTQIKKPVGFLRYRINSQTL
jgi:hypothetical protein